MPIIRLSKALKAWATPAFKQVLKDEIEQLDAILLRLQQGLSQTSYACDDNISVMIIGVSEESGFIRVKAGIFFTGMIPGCSCADDPSPVNEHIEYCEVQFDIDMLTAETAITLM
jgi:hypothetical protein